MLLIVLTQPCHFCRCHFADVLVYPGDCHQHPATSDPTAATGNMQGTCLFTPFTTFSCRHILTTNFAVESTTFSVTGVVCFSREFPFYRSKYQLIIKTALEEAVYDKKSVYKMCFYVPCCLVAFIANMFIIFSLVLFTIGPFVDRALCTVG